MIVLLRFFLYVFFMKKLLLLLTSSLFVTGCQLVITMPQPTAISPVTTSTGSVFPTSKPTPTPTSTSKPISTESGSLITNSFHIPILMYHHIGTYPENADQLRKNLTVSTKSFSEQMAVLQKKGYETITFYDVEAFINGTRDLPKKPVLLTFDDGYDDNFSEALPILEQNKMRAVFFIITDKTGTPGYMNWNQVGVLKKSGHEIGSHSRTHADLKLISANNEKLRDEIIQSKAILEAEKLGPIISFCYPSGQFNEKVVTMAEENYQFARTTLAGTFTQKSRRGELPTIRMQEDVDLNQLLK